MKRPAPAVEKCRACGCARGGDTMTTADEPFNATNRRELAPILGRVENAGRVLALHVDETEWLPCSLELQHDDEGGAASGRILGPGGDPVCSHHLRTRPLFLALFVMFVLHVLSSSYGRLLLLCHTNIKQIQDRSATCRSAPSLWSAGKRATNDRTFCRCAAARALPRRSEKQPERRFARARLRIVVDTARPKRPPPPPHRCKTCRKRCRPSASCSKSQRLRALSLTPSAWRMS